MKNYQVCIYGHSLDANCIKKKFPYSNMKVSKRIINSNRFTITFDIQMAYSYRSSGYSVVAWGGIYNGMNVFVFRKRRVSVRSLPF